MLGKTIAETFSALILKIDDTRRLEFGFTDFRRADQTNSPFRLYLSLLAVESTGLLN